MLVFGCGEFLPTDGSADAEADTDVGRLDASFASMDASKEGGLLPVDGTTGDSSNVQGVRADLVFTGIADAGAPSGVVTLDGEQKFATISITGATAGLHHVEIRSGTSCATVATETMQWSFMPFSVDSSGTSNVTFSEQQSRELFANKLFAFMEADNRVSACGVSFRN